MEDLKEAFMDETNAGRKSLRTLRQGADSLKVLYLFRYIHFSPLFLAEYAAYKVLVFYLAFPDDSTNVVGFVGEL